MCESEGHHSLDRPVCLHHMVVLVAHYFEAEMIIRPNSFVDWRAKTYRAEISPEVGLAWDFLLLNISLPS